MSAPFCRLVFVLSALTIGMAVGRAWQGYASARERATILEEIALRTAARDRLAGTPIPSVEVVGEDGERLDLKELAGGAFWMVDGHACIGCLDHIRRVIPDLDGYDAVFVLSGIPPVEGVAKIRRAGLRSERWIFDPDRRITTSLGVGLPSLQLLTDSGGVIRDVDARHDLASCNWNFIANHVNRSLGDVMH